MIILLGSRVFMKEEIISGKKADHGMGLIVKFILSLYFSTLHPLKK
jgi:hypothetical protein